MYLLSKLDFCFVFLLYLIMLLKLPHSLFIFTLPMYHTILLSYISYFLDILFHILLLFLPVHSQIHFTSSSSHFFCTYWNSCLYIILFSITHYIALLKDKANFFVFDFSIVSIPVLFIFSLHTPIPPLLLSSFFLS